MFMKHTRSRLLVLLFASMLAVAACGSDATTTSTDATPTTVDDTIPDPVTGGGEDVAAPADGGSGDDVADDSVIGRANLGGEVIDPQPHPVIDFVVAESYPEQITITFEAGAEPCLAADAIATGSDTEVTITLLVGISTDALTTSCIAAVFEHSMTIALDEGLDGRNIVVTKAG